MHGDGFADDEAIADELADGLARIGVRDFVNFIRVEPDLAFATANYGGSKALLCREVHPMVETSDQ